MKEESTAVGLDLTHRIRKDGGVEVLHRCRLASALRGTEAAEFLAELADSNSADGQQLMALVTGNYKHGNERVAARHPRNRR